jgi:hypothetical protein
MLSHLSNIIYLVAWTIETHILKREQQKDKDEYKAMLKLEDGGHHDWQFKSTSRIEFLPGQVCKGIILGHDRSGLATGPAILVIGKVNDTMERIGLGWVDQWYYKRWNRDGASRPEKKPTDFGTREHQKVLYSIRYFSPSNLLKSIPLYRYNSQEDNEPKC